MPRFTEEQLLVENLKTPRALEIYEKLTLGAQIKKLRQRAKLTQKKLAKKLKTSQSAIARIETGKQNLTIRMLINLALLLGKKLHIKFQ